MHMRQLSFTRTALMTCNIYIYIHNYNNIFFFFPTIIIIIKYDVLSHSRRCLICWDFFLIDLFLRVGLQRDGGYRRSRAFNRKKRPKKVYRRPMRKNENQR